ncbi:MAG: hypothetical protein JXA41_10615 [Deltaproteobacteria bacterium]|nr:hypothetical protein [Deltaproteobacteria bacterium]
MINKQEEKTTVKDIIEKSISGGSGVGVAGLKDTLEASRLISKVISHSQGSHLKPDVVLTKDEEDFHQLAMQVKMFYHPKHKIGKPQMDYNLGLATYLTLVSDLVKNDNLEAVVQGRYPTKPLDSLTYSKRNNYLLWNNVGYEYNYSFSIIKLIKIGPKQKLYLFVAESQRVPETEKKHGETIETYDACLAYQNKDLVELSFEQCKNHQLGMLSKVAKFDLSFYIGRSLPLHAFTNK